jgi:hypothetical protein
MRIWDISPSKLCRNHLLGEHRELHAMWVVITENKKGYSLHPETLRWKGKLKAMYLRHDQLVLEMTKRGYNHKSNAKQCDYVDSIERQIQILKKKGCSCKI